eukprot:scaffold5179_cov70-Cyclotella_meneghiniana.AAC.4
MPCRSLVVSRVVEKQSHIHVLQTRIMNKVIQSMGIGWRLLEPNIIPEHKGLLFLQQWDCYLSGISSIDSTAGCPNLLRMTATTNRIVNFELSILTPPTHQPPPAPAHSAGLAWWTECKSNNFLFSLTDKLQLALS